jgi:hypothetical protein
MSVGIDKAGEHYLIFAVDLDDFLAMAFYPAIAQSFFAFADGDDLPAYAQDSGIFDDAELAKVWPTAWTGTTRGRAQCQQLTDVCQE